MADLLLLLLLLLLHGISGSFTFLFFPLFFMYFPFIGNLSFSLPVSPITFDSVIKCVGGGLKQGLSLGAMDLSRERLGTPPPSCLFCRKFAFKDAYHNITHTHTGSVYRSHNGKFHTCLLQVESRRCVLRLFNYAA